MNWFAKRRMKRICSMVDWRSPVVATILMINEKIREMRKANELVAMNECTKEIGERRAKYASLNCPVKGSKCMLEQCVFWHEGHRLFEQYDSFFKPNGEFAYGVTAECKLETEKWRL